MNFISLNADKQELSNSNLVSFSSSLHNGLEIFEKYLKNLL